MVLFPSHTTFSIIESPFCNINLNKYTIRLTVLTTLVNLYSHFALYFLNNQISQCYQSHIVI